jgi:hypothetical protein
MKKIENNNKWIYGISNVNIIVEVNEDIFHEKY